MSACDEHCEPHSACCDGVWNGSGVECDDECQCHDCVTQRVTAGDDAS